MQELFLTIITVSRNDHKRLAETIRSLENFYGDLRFEHIVVDGKSNDLTHKILTEKCRYENFRFISEKDRGIYDAMNKGVSLAKGRYLLFLNCGDRMLASPSCLFSWLQSIIAGEPKDIVCFHSRVQHATHAFILKPRAATHFRMPTSHQAMLFSKYFVNRHLYDISYSIAADFNLYLKAHSSRVAVFSDAEPLTSIEAVGVASENPIQSYKEYLRAVSDNLSRWDKWSAYGRIGSKAVGAILLKKVLPKVISNRLIKLIRESCRE